LLARAERTARQVGVAVDRVGVGHRLEVKVGRHGS
jgi:hypothetical protein